MRPVLRPSADQAASQGKAVIGQAYALKTRALVKLGELLKELPKATGRRLAGREPGSNKGVGGSRSAPPTNATTYADLGVTKKLASVAQQLAALPAATREASSFGSCRIRLLLLARHRR